MSGMVFVTGGTGVVGVRAVAGLVASGHHVRAVARSAAKADMLRAARAEPVEVDLFDAGAVKTAAAGCDAILHLATNIPRMRDMREPDAWATNARLRTVATAILLDAARVHGIGTFVKESITFTYPDRGSDWIDETVELGGSGAVMRDAVEGEHLVGAFTDEGGRGVILRFGSFLAPDAHHTDAYLRLARWRIGPGAGDPGGFTSSVHAEDAASAVVAALGAPAGVYNVVDDEPLTRRDFTDAFSAAFGFGHLFVTRPWMLKVAGGSGAASLLGSQRVSNRRFRGVTGWAPAYPSAREGWAAVAADRRRDGGNPEGERPEGERQASRA